MSAVWKGKAYPQPQATTSYCCHRNLLSFWDDQHPDAKTPFAWTPRNIIAIPAACLVRKLPQVQKNVFDLAAGRTSCTPQLVKLQVHCCNCLQCALLANSAGIGGGPFYIPLMNVVVGFSLQQCVGLSHTIVSTSAIASALYGLTHTRPGYPDRPLVDLDVALIFIPALLFGTSVGMLLSEPFKLCTWAIKPHIMYVTPTSSKRRQN